jgi:hypothetical protein
LRSTAAAGFSGFPGLFRLDASDSEAAFARAFKRLVGKPPAAWRRERDAMAV